MAAYRIFGRRKPPIWPAGYLAKSNIRHQISGPFLLYVHVILYRVRIVAVVASTLRGRGRVHIKSLDQHSRDLATLGPEVPLGHPTVNPLSYQENSSIRCKTESEANRPQIQLPSRCRGDINLSSPPLFLHPF